MTHLDPAQLVSLLAPFPCVVFDLDGTVYDVRDFERPALRGIAEWLRGHSGMELAHAEQELWRVREADRHGRSLFDDFLRSHGLPPEWAPECVRLFRDYDGAALAQSESLRPQLLGLRESGSALALVSNGRSEIQMRKLRMLRVADLFEKVVFCEPERPWRLKPSVWAWQELAPWRAGRRCSYVGDDPVDLEFAAAAAVPFHCFRFRSPSYGD
jgi:FMN phosphatase YigB (HAD superfamily)